MGRNVSLYISSLRLFPFLSRTSLFQWPPVECPSLLSSVKMTPHRRPFRLSDNADLLVERHLLTLCTPGPRPRVHAVMNQSDLTCLPHPLPRPLNPLIPPPAFPRILPHSPPSSRASHYAPPFQPPVPPPLPPRRYDTHPPSPPQLSLSRISTASSSSFPQALLNPISPQQSPLGGRDTGE